VSCPPLQHRGCSLHQVKVLFSCTAYYLSFPPLPAYSTDIVPFDESLIVCMCLSLPFPSCLRYLTFASQRIFLFFCMRCSFSPHLTTHPFLPMVPRLVFSNSQKICSSSACVCPSHPFLPTVPYFCKSMYFSFVCIRFSFSPPRPPFYNHPFPCERKVSALHPTPTPPHRMLPPYLSYRLFAYLFIYARHHLIMCPLEQRCDLAILMQKYSRQ
jgi:hypothetical protein